MKEQIERIEKMEACLDRADAAVGALERAWEAYSAAREDIRRLGEYLNSAERRSDLAADEAGLLPAELKRGVLSEDGIWNLLERSDELMAEIGCMNSDNEADPNK